MPRCGLSFLCPPCRVRCGAGFPACGRLSSRPGAPLPTALCSTQCRALQGRTSVSAPSPPISVLFHALEKAPFLVEQAARLAMPAVTPAEPHNPERYGSPDAIRPARLRAPPQPAPSLPISVSSVSSVVCFFSVPSVACPMCGRLSSRPWPLLPTALFHPPCTPVLSSPYEHFAIDAPLNRKISCDPFSRQ